MDLYIRSKPRGWITYLKTPNDIRQFISDYRLGSKVILGDVSSWSFQAINTVLKFIEDNESIDLYSSSDVVVSTILSRAVNVFKEPITFYDDSVVIEHISYENVGSLHLSSADSLDIVCAPRYLRSLFQDLI